MAPRWESPIYELRSPRKRVVIDVTTSISPGLEPHQILRTELIPLLKRKGNVRSVLDFGAGALRHTFPLLRAGFEVCAVEFEEAFSRPTSQKALKKAKRNANFSKLIWPRDFLRDRRKFDVVLLSFVLQIMPKPQERLDILKSLGKKLRNDGYVLYLSRYGQITREMKKNRIGDGYYMWPNRDVHSFYREFTTEETHNMMERRKFKSLRNWSARGTEQVLLYGKGRSTWI